MDHKNSDGHKNLYKNGIVSFNIQLNAGIILRNSQVFAINFHRLLYYISQRQSNAFDVYYYYYVACLSVAGLLVWCGGVSRPPCRYEQIYRVVTIPLVICWPSHSGSIHPSIQATAARSEMRDCPRTVLCRPIIFIIIIIPWAKKECRMDRDIPSLMHIN